METMESVLEQHKDAMLTEYAEQEKLTQKLYLRIAAMFSEDFAEISRKRRLKIVLACIRDVLEEAHEQNVKKKYAMDLLGLFMDAKVMGFLSEILGEEMDRYVDSLNGARAELRHAQWSDGSSRHWQRAVARFL